LVTLVWDSDEPGAEPPVLPAAAFVSAGLEGG